MASPSSSRKSRVKGRPGRYTTSGLEQGSMIRHSDSFSSPAFPLAAFLWPTKGLTSQWVVLPSVLMIVGLFRWCVGLWGYSGLKSPPMHGDFEAQRHWMEITNHLPVVQWYFHDLEWWGLDYPPLTAYHSWLFGKIGSLIDPNWFTLHASRGLDDPRLKIYMRATVVISEFLVLVPAAVVFFRRYARLQGVSASESTIALVALLMQPSMILIDHAHFQYNTVMLGFVLASISAYYAERRLWTSVFFVAALGFKQMALYYAPAIFIALLAACTSPRLRPGLFLSIALVTVASFILLFAPFLVFAMIDGPAHDSNGVILEVPFPFISSLPQIASLVQDTQAQYYPPLQQLGQAIHRIFPFARGIFEDKVANVWCALNVVVKLRHYPVALLQRASLMATLSAVIPPCTLLFLRPQKDLFLFATAATAWAFFLFSFQVHEKSVLLPLLPMTLGLAQRGGLTPALRAWVGWANLLGVWTMFPLLKRDELRVPYFVLTLLWAFLLGLPPTTLSAYSNDGQHGALSLSTKILHLSFYSAMVFWHFAEAFIEPPQRKPDLWVVINAGIGAAGFGICYLWCVWQCIRLSGYFDSVLRSRLVERSHQSPTKRRSIN